MKKAIFTLAALAVTALIGVAGEAAAKGPKPARPRLHFGPGLPHQHGQAAPANMLSRTELQWCVDRQGLLDTTGAAIAANQADLDARAEAVDTYSQLSVSAYNALVDALNTKVRANNENIDDWNSRCARRSYYVSDMTAVRGK